MKKVIITLMAVATLMNLAGCKKETRIKTPDEVDANYAGSEIGVSEICKSNYWNEFNELAAQRDRSTDKRPDASSILDNINR